MREVRTRGGVSRGRESRAFSVTEVLQAAREPDQCVYLEESIDGLSGDAARAAGAATLAPHVHARRVLLTLAEPLRAEPALRLRTIADASPGEQLPLWFDEEVLALIDMPFLTLRNIQGRKNYVCHECDVEFEQPNPLKVHLFLSCRAFTPPDFWSVVRARLARAPACPVPTPCPVPAPVLCPARLEALATEWGRSAGRAGGHACVYCGKLYSRKYGLKIHIRTHTGYKPLRCRYCRRAFGDPSNLNKHVRLHRAAT